VCERVTSIFDIDEDGHDAELGNCRYAMRGSGEPTQFVCPQCSGKVFAVYPAFSYQFEIGEFEADQVEHIQDFFDVFALEVRCKHCGTVSIPSEYEA
jgi:hypothetical protein